MKKIIILILALFISYNISFASDCKEEVIKDAINPVFSPDGKSFAYVKTAGKNGDIVIKDGKQIGGAFKQLYDMKFSPDGKSLAYTVWIMNSEKDSYKAIIKDGEKIFKSGGPRDTFGGGDQDRIGIIFSPDGKSFILTLETSDGLWYMFDDRYIISLGGGLENTYNGTFSQDGKHFAYIATKGKRFDPKTDKIIVKDGEILEGKYKMVRSLAFSPDGKSLAYTVKKDNGKEVVIKDGKEISGEFDLIYDIQFSPDGKSFVYRVKKDDGKEVVIKDGEENIGKFKSTYNPLFSPDGKSFVYIAEKDNGKKVVIKDGKQIGGEFYSISNMQFSPDGKSFVYFGHKDNSSKVIIKDGKELIFKYKYQIINDFTFGADGNNYAYTLGEDYGVRFTVKRTCSENNETEITNKNTNEDTTNEQAIYYLDMYNTSKNAMTLTKDEKYIKKIDNIVPQMTKKNLENLFIKVKKINTTNKVIKYLEAKIYFELNQ